MLIVIQLKRFTATVIVMFTHVAEMLMALHQDSVQVAAILLLTVMLGIILMVVGIPLIK